MSNRRVLIYHSPAGRERPERIADLARGQDLEVREQPDAGGVIDAVNRSYPAGVVIELDAERAGLELCIRLKSDTFTGIVPVLFLLQDGSGEALRLDALEAGADELLEDGMSDRERRLRFSRALDRASRDVSVHPTTRLAGTAQIERDIAERLHQGELFACCYADLDHFKEFNDRYGYNQGDRVIRMLSRILRDTVKYYAPTGFIGHIGGDDFIFDVPLEAMRITCEEIISIFDELVPYQYNERDRRAGYFLGKDRRGTLHRVPLMTLSVGVVTTQYRHFTHTGRVSELVTEMKAYAKSLPGSVYAVDRRRDVRPGKAAELSTAQTQPEPKP
jgi:GGDEF domain-containing protein